MTNKQQRKALRREKTDLARKTQDQWIKHFGLDAPSNRRERDRRFMAAQKLSLIMQGATGAAS